ncbi:hypothetical protein TNIN_412011, partial [Trichonephila inaurata madagascariensis]
KIRYLIWEQNYLKYGRSSSLCSFA